MLFVSHVICQSCSLSDFLPEFIGVSYGIKLCVQTDSFVIEAVDLGRLEKVVIGLKNPGFGSSWKLQCVIVRVSEKESFVFPWGK